MMNALEGHKLISVEQDLSPLKNFVEILTPFQGGQTFNYLL